MTATQRQEVVNAYLIKKDLQRCGLHRQTLSRIISAGPKSHQSVLPRERPSESTHTEEKRR